MKRISILASLTKSYSTICDIGCDHAYVLIEALKHYGVKYAYAIDINKEPLERARLNATKANLADKVSFFLSDGLRDCDIDFDLAIISGMGGILIKKILANSFAKFKGKDLLLSPQGDADVLRWFLYLNGYKIKLETAIEENNKYYEIILAIPGKENLDSLSITFGPRLLENRNEIFLKHWAKLLNIKEKAYKLSRDIKLKEEIFKIKYVVEDKMEKELYFKSNYYTKLLIDENKRDLVIIFPGGGYNHTSPREAENIALKFNALGLNALVFHYRETLDTYETLFNSIADAINNFVAKHDIANIYLNGYSAGGHLALELANHQDLYKLPQIKGLILCYPVVSAAKKAIHQGSFDNLLGGNKQLEERYSEEKEVNKTTPPVFLWHTCTDQSVPVLNSISLMETLTSHQINFESHIFPMGGHGLGLATKETARDENDIIPYVAVWFDMVSKWLGIRN